jgi:hypothetical protein
LYTAVQQNSIFGIDHSFLSMKKIRRRLIFWGLFMVIAAFVGYQAWRLLQIRERLQELVKAQLEAAFGQRAHFEGVTLGAGAVHLRDVRLTPAQSPFQLLIDELSVDFNLFHLLTNGFKPERTATKIVLTKPQLLIHRMKNNPEPGTAMSMTPLRTLNAAGNGSPQRSGAPPDYSFIDNVTISDGRIILIDSLSGASSLIADGVSGWLESQGDGKAVAKMAGHLFSSEAFDLVVEAGINFRRGSLSYVQATLRDHRIAGRLPFIVPESIKLLDGRLNGNLRVAARAPRAAGYDIAGRFYLRDGAVETLDGRLKFSDIDMDVSVNDWNLRITQGRQLCNGSPMNISGNIDNLTHPRFDVNVASDSLSLRHLAALFSNPAPEKMDGMIKLRASIRDSLSNLQITGRVFAPALRLGSVQARSLSARFTLADSVLRVGDLSGDLNAVSCKGSGEISLNEPGAPLDFGLIAEGDFAPALGSLLSLPVAENHGTVVAHASGSLANPHVAGRFELNPPSDGPSGFSLSGNFTFADGALQVDAATSPGDSLMRLSVRAVGGRDFYKMRGRGLERMLRFSKDTRLAEQMKKFRIDLGAGGPLDSLSLMLTLTDRARATSLLQVVASVAEEAGEYRSTGYLRTFPGAYNEFTVRYAGVYRDSTIIVENFSSESWLDGSLQLALGGDRRLRGRMRISGADLSQLVEGIEREPPNYAGRLFADLKFGGTMRAPSLGGNLWLVDGLLHGIGSFTAEAEVRVNRAGIQLAPLTVQKDGVQYLRAAGSYDFSGEIDLQASVKNIDARDFLQAAANVNDVLWGRASFDLRIAGSGPRFPLYGSIELRDGKLVWFSYDRLFLDFGEAAGTGNGAYLSSRALYAPSVQYEKENTHRLNGSAVVPLTNSDSLRVALVGDGNFLSIVRDFTDYFEQPRSNGHLALQLSGTYHDLKLHDTSLQFNDGFMRLGNVAHAITELSGDFFLDSRGEFVEIQQLNGRIGDATLSIQNQEAPVAANGHVKLPFRLFDSELSLGTLIVNSSNNGLLLHVPGLMEQGEIGRFIIRGREGEKGFFIAGPWAHPKFRGQVELEGVNFMFPFDASGEPPDSLLMEVLWNIDYDVRVVSRKDNRYVQKIPSPLDNVYVNLGIDDNVSALEFTGIIADSSFRTQGHGESTRGNIEYLDLNFRVEKFGIDFDKNDLWPTVYGRAWTVYTDSTNFPQNIYLTPHTRNVETGEELSGGRWDNVYFKLSSDNPNYGESQAQILAALGYSLETAGARATEAVGTATDNRLLRPLFRPVERQLKRRLGLDIVRLSSRLTRNFIEYNLGASTFDLRSALWRDTRLTLGKYLSDDLYFLYNGQIEAGIDYRYHERGYGLRHILGMEYRVNPTLLFQVEYDVNTLLLRDKMDWKLWLRHSFTF